MLAGAYALGTVNRWREGGWSSAAYASSGVAGTTVFLGAGVMAAGWYFHHGLLIAGGGLLALAGLALAAAGFLAEAGGGGAGRIQATVECFDLVVRLGSNVVSFTRLAAFGLTHAALGLLVWEGTRALWHRGGFARRGGRGRLRGRDRAGVQPGSARRRHPGAPPGVLRTVLARLREPGPAVQAMARADGKRPDRLPRGSPRLARKRRAHDIRMGSRIAPHRRGRRAGARGDAARAVRDLHPGRDRRAADDRRRGPARGRAHRRARRGSRRGRRGQVRRDGVRDIVELRPHCSARRSRSLGRRSVRASPSPTRAPRPWPP